MRLRDQRIAASWVPAPTDSSQSAVKQRKKDNSFVRSTLMSKVGPHDWNSTCNKCPGMDFDSFILNDNLVKIVANVF